MLQTISFRGLQIDNYCTWTAGNPDDVRIVRHETTGNKTEFKIFNSRPNGEKKTIEVEYVKTVKDSNGDILGVEAQPKLINTTFYDLFAQMSFSGNQFDLTRRPELNAILQVICEDERAICFDPTSNYEPIQPIIFNLDVNDLDITVTNVSIDGAKTPEYSLDGTTWQDSNVLKASGYGSQTVYVRYKTELYNFKLNINLIDPNA